MGPANILVIVLTTCAPDLTNRQAKLFQYCNSTGIYRQRGTLFSLLLITKVMKSIINSAIQQQLLSDTPFGFRKDHSAPDIVTDLIRKFTNTEFQRLNESDRPVLHLDHLVP
eukprot:g25253.t1